MLNKSKKALILIILFILSLNSIGKEIPRTESVEPLFTLKARGLEIQQLECLNLIKQQLAAIRINLDIEYFNISEVGFPATLIAFRDFDLQLLELPCSFTDDPFIEEFYTENGSLNLAGYHTSMDWNEELGTGKNEWYIQTGLEMTPNDSQERINHCYEWQHYMMDDILPILPLFTQKGNHSSFELLYFNMREVRPLVGSRAPAPSIASKSIGLLIRKAISYAINREEIRRVVLGDDYEIIHHPTDPIMDEWLNPNSIRYCHSLRAAGDLMTVVGYDGCWRPSPYTYIGFGPWPNWEDVCAGNMTTSSNPGFTLIIVIAGFLTLSQVFLIKRLKSFKINRRFEKRRKLER